MGTAVRRVAAEFVQGRLESACKLLRGADAPVVEKIDSWLAARHVIVNGDDVQAVSAKGFQNGRDFLAEHSDVAGNLGIGIAAVERGPRVEPHSGVDGRAHFLEVNVVTAERNLVDRPALLA